MGVWCPGIARVVAGGSAQTRWLWGRGRGQGLLGGGPSQRGWHSATRPLGCGRDCGGGQCLLSQPQAVSASSGDPSVWR